MYKALLPAVMLFLTVPAQARAHEKPSDYHTIVPSDWKLLSEDPTSHERRFVSPTGDAWLALYAEPADRDQSKFTLPTSDSMKTKELLTSAKSKLGSLSPATKRSCQDLARHTQGRSGHLCMGGTSFDWAALAVAWLMTFAIGIAIYFLPIARLLDSLTE